MKSIINFIRTKRYLLFFVIIAIEILCIVLITNKNYNNLLTIDFSGNILLGKIIAQDGRLIFTHNWYYGNEIRFIHSQIIYALLFRMTSDFKVVTLTSIIIQLILFLICFYIFLKCIKKTKYFPLFAFLILLPWPIGAYSAASYPYFSIILIQQDYIPYLCFSFLILGLTIYYFKNKKHFIFILISSSILTILYSISGYRALISLIAPIFIVYLFIFLKDFIINKKEVFNKRKNEIILIVSLVFFCFLGVVINKFILPKIFLNFNSNTFKIGIYLDRIKNAFLTLFRSLSIPIYDVREGSINAGIVIFQSLIFISIVLLISYTIYNFIKGNLFFEEKFLFCFIVIGMILTFLSYCVTNFPNDSYMFRYYFLLEFYFACFFDRFIIFILNIFKKSKINKIIYCPILFSISTIFILLPYHFTFNMPSKRPNLENVVNVIKSEGYKIVYSSMYDANSISQLSNASLDSYTYKSANEEHLFSNNWICEIKKNYKQTNHISVVFEKEDQNTTLYEKCNLLTKNVKEINNYKVFFVEDATSLFD